MEHKHFSGVTARRPARPYRCRIARREGKLLMVIHYVGPLAGIPAGWSMITRRPA